MQKNISYFNENKKRVIRRSMVIFLTAMLLLTLFSNTLNNFLSPRVSVEKPEGGQLVKEINSMGKVQAKNILDFYIQSQLKVLEQPVKVGDKVKKGQLLIKLDTSDIAQQLESERIILQQKKLGIQKLTQKKSEVNLASYENAVESAKLKMEKAKKKYNDTKELYEIGAEAQVNVNDTKGEYDLAQMDYKKAQQDYINAKKQQEGENKNSEADIKNAQLDIELQQKKIEKLEMQLGMNKVTAPRDGMVLELNFKEGAMADSSKPLYRLADTKKGFEFVAAVDSEAAKQLNSGVNAEVSLDNMEGYAIEGTVSSIADNKENMSRKKDVFIDIPPDNIYGGENGSVTIKINSKTYDAMVSNSALGQDNSGYFVYIVREQSGPLGNQSVAQKVRVLVGESDNSKTGITSGLSSSDRVITGSDKQLSEGMKVSLVPEVED